MLLINVGKVHNSDNTVIFTSLYFIPESVSYHDQQWSEKVDNGLIMGRKNG